MVLTIRRQVSSSKIEKTFVYENNSCNLNETPTQKRKRKRLASFRSAEEVIVLRKRSNRMNNLKRSFSLCTSSKRNVRDTIEDVYLPSNCAHSSNLSIKSKRGKVRSSLQNLPEKENTRFRESATIVSLSCCESAELHSLVRNDSRSIMLQAREPPERRLSSSLSEILQKKSEEKSPGVARKSLVKKHHSHTDLWKADDTVSVKRNWSFMIDVIRSGQHKRGSFSIEKKTRLKNMHVSLESIILEQLIDHIANHRCDKLREFLAQCGAYPGLSAALCHEAAYQGCVECCYTLLKHGCSMNTPDVQGWLPLHAAVLGNKTSTVGYLLPLSTNVNTVSSDGLSPLHIAVYANNLPLVRLLVKFSADVHLSSAANKSPFRLAAFLRRSEILDLFILGSKK